MFLFNVPPTAKVIWRWGHGFKVSSDGLVKQRSNLQPLVYKASGLSTKYPTAAPNVLVILAYIIFWLMIDKFKFQLKESPKRQIVSQ